MIETDRCTLKLPSTGDLEATIDFYTVNRSHFAPWESELPDSVYFANYWAERLKAAKIEFENNESLRLHIYLKENNTLIGKIDFTGFERGPFQNCRLEYKIAAKYEGEGLMKEALGGAIDYVFKVLNFHRIEACYMPKNERSRRLLEGLGFTEIGLAEKYLRFAGVWQDHVLSSLVNKNWKESSQE